MNTVEQQLNAQKTLYREIFLKSVDEIQKRLGFDKLICTRHNSKTGIIIGENCRDEEKVNRLYQEFDKDSINVIDVYSDSLTHDKPIFSLGKNCYHIVNSEKIPFHFDEVYTK